MLPTVKGQLSLLNSIFELKDIMSVKKSAGLLISAIKELSTLILGGKNLGQTLKQLARLGGDHYLQWKFNVAPLISDVQGIYRALANYERRINDLITRSGKLRTCHYSKSLDDGGVIVSDWTTEGGMPYPLSKEGHGTYYLSGLKSERRTVNTMPTKFHAQIQYNYLYDGFQREHAHVLALLDALGVNLNPAIIWNAIPWSFVVDWLIGVSRWLDNLKIGNMEPKINILQYSWSVKRERRIFVDLRVKANKYYSGYSSGQYPAEYMSSPGILETSYRRQCGLPARSWFETSGLSSTEFSLGAALVITRSRRHKRNRAR